MCEQLFPLPTTLKVLRAGRILRNLKGVRVLKKKFTTYPNGQPALRVIFPSEEGLESRLGVGFCGL